MFFFSVFIAEKPFRVVLYLFAVNFSASAIHDSHECLLVPPKVDFVRAKNRLELALIVLHVLLTGKLTNLVYGLSIFCKQTHVFSTCKRYRLHRVS